MNKLSHCFLSIPLALGLAACGGGGGDSSSNNKPPQPSLPVATTEVFVGDVIVARLENGQTKTVPLANLNDVTSYGNGHSKRGDVLLIPSTSGVVVYNMATSSVVREIPFTGQIVNVRHLDDSTALVLRRRERYSFVENGRPATDANNLLTVNLTTGAVTNMVQLGNTDTHLANGLSVDVGGRNAWVILNALAGAGKVVKISLGDGAIKDVSSITGNAIQCGENTSTVFLCRQGGGGFALSKTDGSTRPLTTEAEAQGYAEDSTYAYYTLFSAAQLVRVTKATGGKEMLATGANPTSVFIGKTGDILVLDSDPATTPSKRRLMKYTFTSAPSEVYSAGILYQYDFR